MIEKIYLTLNANVLFDNVFLAYYPDTTIEKIRAYVADMFVKHHFSKAVATDLNTNETIAIFYDNGETAYLDGFYEDEDDEDY